MYKEVLNHAAHYTWYAEVGLIIFAVVFVGVTIGAVLHRREDVKAWSRLPLDD